MFNQRLTRITLALVATTVLAAASLSASTPRGVAPEVKEVKIAPFYPPTLTPRPGTYAAPQTVTMVDAAVGAIFYYTTNGTTPTSASTRYTGPISVTKSETIRVIAVASGRVSAVGTNVYTIK